MGELRAVARERAELAFDRVGRRRRELEALANTFGAAVRLIPTHDGTEHLAGGRRDRHVIRVRGVRRRRPYLRRHAVLADERAHLGGEISAGPLLDGPGAQDGGRGARLLEAFRRVAVVADGRTAEHAPPPPPRSSTRASSSTNAGQASAARYMSACEIVTPATVPAAKSRRPSSNFQPSDLSRFTRPSSGCQDRSSGFPHPRFSRSGERIPPCARRAIFGSRLRPVTPCRYVASTSGT